MSYSLYLYPQLKLDAENDQGGDKIAILESHQIDATLNQLVQHEFISVLTAPSTAYVSGRKLMEFINFLGCSPTLSSGNLESEIRFHHFTKRVGLGGESVTQLRYPGCKHTIKEPAQVLKSYLVENTWQCPECSNKGLLNQINWRKSAGFSNWFIEISPVFPKEAIPGDHLLELLKEASGVPWAWFYSKSSD